MATIDTLYAVKTAIAVTLTSLANGAARQSAVFDNTAAKYLDLLLRIKANGQTGGTGTLDVYVYAALGDSANYTDGATGADAAFTAANRKNAIYLGSVQMDAATGVTATLGGVAALFNGVLPQQVGFIFINSSGASLSPTAGDHVIEVQGIEGSAA